MRRYFSQWSDSNGRRGSDWDAYQPRRCVGCPIEGSSSARHRRRARPRVSTRVVRVHWLMAFSGVSLALLRISPAHRSMQYLHGGWRRHRMVRLRASPQDERVHGLRHALPRAAGATSACQCPRGPGGWSQRNPHPACPLTYDHRTLVTSTVAGPDVPVLERASQQHDGGGKRRPVFAQLQVLCGRWRVTAEERLRHQAGGGEGGASPQLE